MRWSQFFIFVVLLLFSWSCKTNKGSTVSTPEEISRVVFLDSAEASKVVIVDQEDGFFEEVGILDMKIQMKRNYPSATSRDVVLRDYKKFLQEDITTFSSREKEGLTKVFNMAFELCQKINGDIYPENLQLLKSKGGPYGTATFYTRDNSIVIPAGLLAPGNIPLILDVALHEIFHIFSRYHPERRKELYATIGFKPVEKDLLALSDSLKYRLLLNPDGINYGYLIKLQTPEGRKIQALPLIVSKKPDFDPEDPAFFSYLQFDLYEIKPPFVRRIEVLAKEDGSSTINFQNIPNFFEQIKDNTQYIIHPDEILADNFVLVALNHAMEEEEAGHDHDHHSPLSEGGQQLLEQVEEILRKPIQR